MRSVLLLSADLLAITQHLILLSKHIFRQNTPWPSNLELVLLKSNCHRGSSLINGLLVTIHIKYFLLLSCQSLIVLNIWLANDNVLSWLICKTISHILSRSLWNWLILCYHKVISVLCWILLWSIYNWCFIELICIIELTIISLCVCSTLTWIRN